MLCGKGGILLSINHEHHVCVDALEPDRVQENTCWIEVSHPQYDVGVTAIEVTILFFWPIDNLEFLESKSMGRI